MTGGDAAIAAGTPTFHTRAEGWECDFNGHWNTRYYCRAVQTAAEVAAALHGVEHPDSVAPAGRHMRFHAELHSGDPVEIRSFDLADHGGAPAVAHVLTTHGKVAATALDTGVARCETFAALPETLSAQVLPRGLTGEVPATWLPDPARDIIVELGPVRAGEAHGDGTLRFDHLVARLAIASHTHAMGIGYTLEFTARSGIGRMLAELRYTWLAPCAPGMFLRGASRIAAAAGKSYVTEHLIYGHDGTPVALFELATLAVDMAARRATELPGFVLDLVE